MNQKELRIINLLNYDIFTLIGLLGVTILQQVTIDIAVLIYNGFRILTPIISLVFFTILKSKKIRHELSFFIKQGINIFEERIDKLSAKLKTDKKSNIYTKLAREARKWEEFERFKKPHKYVLYYIIAIILAIFGPIFIPEIIIKNTSPMILKNQILFASFFFGFYAFIQLITPLFFIFKKKMNFV